MKPELHIQFQQHKETGRLAIVDDTQKIHRSHAKQVVEWLYGVAVQKPGVKLFLDVMESAPDLDLTKPTVYRNIRFQAHRMSARVPFTDGHMETLYFMLAATEDWSVQIVGSRVSPDNWRLIPWNQTPHRELRQGNKVELVQ